MSPRQALLAGLLVLRPVLIAALVCYETAEDGTVAEVESALWTHCVYVPSFGTASGASKKPQVFGIGEASDDTTFFNTILRQSDDASYQILNFCLLEKYDYGLVTGALSSPPDFIFRCICNTDRCNAPLINFGAYIHSIEQSSSSSSRQPQLAAVVESPPSPNSLAAAAIQL